MSAENIKRSLNSFRSKKTLKSILVNLVGPPSIIKESLLQLITSENYHAINGPMELKFFEVRETAFEQIIVVLESSSECNLNKLLKEIMAVNSAARIVLLVDATNTNELSRILRAPAHAFLCNKADFNLLISTFEVVLGGGGVISFDLMPCFISTLKNDDPEVVFQQIVPQSPIDLLRPLSNREQDVLSGLKGGKSNKTIARHFDIAESTVKIHVKSILRKLNVQNRTQAAVWASDRSTLPTIV